MEKVVVYSKDIENYLNDLIDILFYQDYFSYIENAETYVENLKDEIENYIDIKQHYNSPRNLIHFGKQFMVVSLNNRTSWYIFFDRKDNRFLIQFITNNHSEDSKNLLNILE